MANDTALVEKRRHDTQLSALGQFLANGKKSLSAVAAQCITPERLARIAIVAASRNPKLAQCDQRSFLGALMDCAANGLEPFTPQQHAYIIPYYNNKTGVMEAQFQAGYRGLIHVARRSGDIDSIEAYNVYDGDEFEVELGVSPTIKHKPRYGANERDKIIATYAVVRYPNGKHQFDVMSVAELESVRKMSKSPTSGAWQNSLGEMYKKVVIKRLLKIATGNPAMARAIAADNKSETAFDTDCIDIDMIDIEMPDMEETKTIGERNAQYNSEMAPPVDLDKRKATIAINVRNIVGVDDKTVSDILARVHAAKSTSELDAVESYLIPLLKGKK